MISGVGNNCNSVNFKGRLGNIANKAKQSFYDLIKNHVVNEGGDRFYKFAGEKISSAEVRLILGTTALMSQPFIDFHNHKQDEETRMVSVCRTVAKIIAGMTTGFFVRKGAIKFIQACSKHPVENFPKWRTMFTPKNISTMSERDLRNHQNDIGTWISLGVMLFTNFLIDAPLTKFLTNVFTSKVVKKPQDKEMRGEA